MWQRLSLRARINLLLALVLTLGLAINVARLVLEAAPRVQAEDQSVMRLAREFIETMSPALNEAPDPEARLDRIVDDLKRLRHVSITRQDDGRRRRPARVGRQRRRALAPAWFVALVHPENDLRQRADLDQRQADIAADHLASRTTRSPRSGTAS